MGLPNTVNQLFNGGSPYYIVNRSLRFRSSASAYLNRTPSVAGTRTKFTYSAWVKRGALGINGAIFDAYSDVQNYCILQFFSDNTLSWYNQNGAATITLHLNTTQVFRDPGAWYHILVNYDSTQATSTDRAAIYINGVKVTAFGTATYPSLNTTAWANATVPHDIGRYGGASNYFDGYLAEVNFIDGQQLTPSSFGAFDTNGIWQPIRYAGTYGTNGFYLPFNNTTSTTTLVADASGNGNNWTPNNISLTAGTTYDSMLDSPTVSNASSNYAVLNPLGPSVTVLSNGNMTYTNSSGSDASSRITATIGTPNTGKWYWEVTSQSSANIVGIATRSAQSDTYVGGDSISWGYYYSGLKITNASSSAYGASYTTNDIIGVALDIDSGTLVFYKNGVSQGTAFSGLTAQTYFPAFSQSTAVGTVNFGQRPFSYTPPSGYNALNTANLPAATISYGAPYMNAITYTGYGPLIPSGLGIPTKRNALNQNVSRSLRFRSSVNAYLSRTIGSPSQTTNTLSVWVKRGSTIGSAYNPILGCTATNSVLNFQFPSSALNDTIQYVDNNVSIIATNAVYRDPSAWVHVVFVWDTTNATQTDRLRLYVDGVRVTSFNYANYPALNATYSLFAASGNWQIGSRQNPGALYFDGYMAQFYYIDGQALTAASFGELNSDGVWVPKSYTGTYGTNGFYLPFTNTTSTTTLVADSSGNGNNFTPNNISLTAGTTYDSMIDSPTDYASAGNYAVLNPLYPQGATAVLSDGNLQSTTGSTGTKTKPSTIAVSSGQWYWEVTPTAGSAGADYHIGIANADFTTTAVLGSTSTEYSYAHTGVKRNNNTSTAYGATYTTNDIIGVALDLDGGTLTYYKNGVSQGQAFSGISGTYVAVAGDGSTAQTSTFVFNFGQRPFTYSAPSGYSAINTYNITAPSKTWFSSANNSGRGSATAYPDFVWIKSRSSAQNHSLNDTLRGPTLNLLSNSTNAEAGASTMFSVNKYGLTLGNDASVNSSSYTDVMWGWQAGQGTTSTNTSGSITSTVSVSASSGFSLVSYTGTGALATVGHSLGVAPNMIIWKSRSAAENWVVYHSSLGATGNVYLNLTNGFSTDSTTQNNTAPTSSVFTVATSGAVNGSAKNIVAYCFAAVRGYSAFGSYTGNGSTDGPFVFTNMRPRWVMVRASSTGGVGYNWYIYDTSRDSYNVEKARLFPNLSDAELTNANFADFLSNGFKLRSSDTSWNASGVTYIYAAFAENPFSIARAR